MSNRSASRHPGHAGLRNRFVGNPPTGSHDVRLERFYQPGMIANQHNLPAGPIKACSLHGIKDSPPFFHDGRLLTLEDTVEFFNLVLDLKLTQEEKYALVAFMRCL